VCTCFTVIHMLFCHYLSDNGDFHVTRNRYKKLFRKFYVMDIRRNWFWNSCLLLLHNIEQIAFVSLLRTQALLISNSVINNTIYSDIDSLMLKIRQRNKFHLICLAITQSEKYILSYLMLTNWHVITDLHTKY
jgi:hypothetical protein